MCINCIIETATANGMGFSKPHTIAHSKRWPLHPAMGEAYSYAEARFHIIDSDKRESFMDTLAQAIALEWPHVPDNPEARGKVAYTRTIEHAEADRQTVGKLGGYLQRLFPILPGHTIEKIVGAHQARAKPMPDTFEVLTTLPEIIDAMYETKARSCMHGLGDGEDGGERWPKKHHPYNVFDPALGWGLAIHKQGETIIGRALVNGKGWVRMYCAADESKYRTDHPAFKSWLEANGYQKRESFTQCSFRAILRGDYFLAPYLDGCRTADFDGDTFTITPEGSFCFDNTEGLIAGDNHCGEVETYEGEWIPEDEAVHLNYRNNGLRRDGYWHVSDVTMLHNGDYALSEDAVELYAGEWALSEDAVELHNGEYALADDEDVICLHDGDYALVEDAVELHEGEWALQNDVVELHDGSFALEEDAHEVNGTFYLLDDLVKTEEIGGYAPEDECTLLPNGEWCHESRLWLYEDMLKTQKVG